MKIASIFALIYFRRLPNGNTFHFLVVTFKSLWFGCAKSIGDKLHKVFERIEDEFEKREPHDQDVNVGM